MRGLVLLTSLSCVLFGPVSALEAHRHAALGILKGHPLQNLNNGADSSYVEPTREGVQPTPIDRHATERRRTDDEAEWAGATQYVELERRYILPKETAANHAPVRTENNIVDTRPPPPHIRDTLSLISTIFRHPLRYSWLAVKLAFRLIWRVIAFCLGFVWLLVRPLLVPFYIAVVVPSSLALTIVGELQPLITFLLSASLLGLAIGVVAGLSNGMVSDYLWQMPFSKPSPASSPTRTRSGSGSSNYAIPYFDSPARSRRINYNDDDDEDDDAEIDSDFRASLKFPPMPPPYGRKPSRSGGDDGNDESGSDQGDDEKPPSPTMPMLTPSANNGVSSADKGKQPERPQLRHRTASQTSVSSATSTGSIRPALLSPMTERPPRTTPKEVRWVE